MLYQILFVNFEFVIESRVFQEFIIYLHSISFNFISIFVDCRESGLWPFNNCCCARNRKDIRRLAGTITK